MNTDTPSPLVFIGAMNAMFRIAAYLKDQRTLLCLGPIKYLSERSIDNIWAIIIRKIKQLVRSAADQPDLLISQSFHVFGSIESIKPK